MSDPYAFGSLAPQPENPTSAMPDFLSRIPRWLLPHMISLVRGEAAPPLPNMPTEPGKVPSTDDPRIAGAMGEGANLAMNVAPMLMPAGAIGAAARGAEALAPRLGMLARETAPFQSPAGAVPALASSLALSSNSAEAAPRLTREQQRDLEVARQTKQMEAEAARQQAETSTAAARQQAMDAAEADRLKAENAARIQVEQQRQSDTAARENEAALANRPFRDKFPSLANAMSNSGMALSALLPYGTRAWQAGKSSAFIKDWESTVHKAEDALTKGDMGQARLFVNQLSGFGKQAAALEKKVAPSNAALYGMSATAPLETSLLPEAIDMTSGSPDAQSQAWNRITDPQRAMAVGQGVLGAGLGAKIPIPIGNRVSPEAASAGAVKTFREMVKQQAAQKAAETKRRNSGSVVPFGALAP